MKQHTTAKQLKSECCVCGRNFYEDTIQEMYHSQKAFAHPYCIVDAERVREGERAIEETHIK